MIGFLLRMVFLLIPSIYVIYNYYQVGFHMESSSLYWSYILLVAITYAIYKIYFAYSKKDSVKLSPFAIMSLAMLNVLYLCFAFFSAAGRDSWAIVLFFKIIWFLALPLLITLVSYSLAKRILSFSEQYLNESRSFRLVSALWFWFVLFLTPLSTLSFFWLYNYYSVFLIIAVFILASWKELWISFKDLFVTKIEIQWVDQKQDSQDILWLKSISTELSFLIMTFLLWVNFINIVRPMPIWWDDLWVYMNYPNIMAASGAIIRGAWMVSWQILTWIWFMFHSAPQAFFMNQIWWVLSVIVMVAAFSDLLKQKSRSFLNVPMILATMIYAMPMIIFQQAKDMKLDPGLLFLSSAWLYLLIHLLSKMIWFEEEKKSSSTSITENSGLKLLVSRFSSVFVSDSWEKNIFSTNWGRIILLVIGMIVWLAFSVKYTTLMLILWMFGMIFYSNMWFSGFLSFFFMFLAVFTKFNLWAQLNVNYPTDNPNWIMAFYLISFAMAIILLTYSIWKYKKESFLRTLQILVVFTIWILIPILPWFAKNIAEAWVSNLSVSTLLSWKSDLFQADLSKIYSSSELEKIEKKQVTQAIDSEWKTKNEDLWRYFGYEDWINNYLKLPWNLTMQKNQSWEYTDLTYLYLALLPAILVFLSYRSSFALFWIGIILAFEYLYFGNARISSYISEFLAKQVLPGWYLYIIAIFLIILSFLLYSLDNSKKSQIFKLNAVFSTMYVLIFVVAAYWIVWYWIAMYFSFLLAIWIAASQMSEIDESDLNQNTFRFFASIAFLFIVFLYFPKSSFPHWFNNLKAAAFSDFKSWTVNQEEGIFDSHPDYFNILSELNLWDKKRYLSEAVSSISNESLKAVVSSNLWSNPDLSRFKAILDQIINSDLSKSWIDETTWINLKTSAKEALNKMYKDILYPNRSDLNNKAIYRIWTFLTYFISENRARFYDDSLVFNFDKYFYDKDPDVAVEKMKKIGLSYFLVDLNAATIDKDPRHDLTRRYEELLNTFKSKKLELIQTDSLCLRIALEENDSHYLEYAWVNYESYDATWKTINRAVKQFACYNHIGELINTNKISDTKYSYLLPLLNYLKTNPPKDQQAAYDIFQQYVWHWWLVLFKIK